MLLVASFVSPAVNAICGLILSVFAGVGSANAAKQKGLGVILGQSCY
jgi:hypothetical protein